MSRLQCGTAVADLPLESGIQLSGYGVDERGLTEVHDPLRVSSVILSTGARSVALVSVDLLNVSHEFTASVRRRIDASDTPIDDVFLAATHTHAGPYVPADSFEMNPNHRMETDHESIEEFERVTAETVRDAHERLEPASLRVGRATNDVSAVNRRSIGGVMDDVRVPWGEIDPELVVLDIETESGAETILFNYACHPVCTTGAVTRASADWPGQARREISEAEDATVMYLNGAAGDVNPRGRDSSPESGDAVFEYASEIGGEVAETAVEALADARDGPAHTDVSMTCEKRTLPLDLKRTPPEDVLEERLDALEEEIGTLEEQDAASLLTHKRAVRHHVEELLSIARWDGNRLPATVQYVEVGDVGLLGMPGEVFAEHGLDFKAAADVGTLLPVGYANEYVGYLPTLREIENGDYEIQTMKVAPEAVTDFRDAVFDVLPTSR